MPSQTKSQPFERRFFSVGQAAQIIGVHPCTLYRLIGRRAIPHSRIGRNCIRIDRAELERLMKPCQEVK
jgi:excisionase family DNA binding protein